MFLYLIFRRESLEQRDRELASDHRGKLGQMPRARRKVLDANSQQTFQGWGEDQPGCRHREGPSLGSLESSSLRKSAYEFLDVEGIPLRARDDHRPCELIQRGRRREKVGQGGDGGVGEGAEVELDCPVP